MSPVVYRGGRDENGTAHVMKQIDDLAPTPLDMRNDLRNHSPTGPEWSYSGSGPAQLSLALLADVLAEHDAEELYQRFKRDVVARFPREGFTITAEAIEEWARRLEREGEK
jgi:hypothetical protein